MDDTAAGQQQTVPIATLAISTNNATGYTLDVTTDGTLTSTNGGTIAYKVSADLVSATPTFTSKDDTYASTGANALNSNPVSVQIQYTPAALQDPGTYTSQINLSVQDN